MAYPSGLCVERVAIFSAASNFPGIPLQAIAIAAEPISSGGEAEVSPCGACRQVMLEYERILNHPIRIISGVTHGPVSVFENARSLLPLAFFDAGLSKGRG
jgi:cytidine deaminase